MSTSPRPIRARAPRITRFMAIGVATAFMLAGCSSEEPAEPRPTETTSSEAPAPIETSEPTPDTPERPQVDLTVNYEAFRAWDNLNQENKYAACNEFYALNEVAPGIELGRNSSGEEILDLHRKKLYMAYDLNLNTSDERNGEIALNLVECITSLQGDTSNSTRNMLDSSFSLGKSLQDSGQPTFELPTIDSITRYSSVVGLADSANGPYEYKTVEYYEQNELGKELKQEIFKWTQDGKWQSVAIFGPSAGVRYGDQPPVVLDTSRANASW